MLDANRWQPIQLPAQLEACSPCRGRVGIASWAAWLHDNFLLICEEDGHLFTFQPSTGICPHKHFPGFAMQKCNLGDLLAPSKQALLCPIKGLTKVSVVVVLELPSLEPRGHVPCRAHHKPMTWSPAWMGWSPNSNSFAIAWEGPQMAAAGTHLCIYLASDGTLQGHNFLQWPKQRCYERDRFDADVQ